MYKIKQRPEDFKVEEKIDLRLKDKGSYACFLLTKKNWTTLKAIEKIASRLNVNEKRFSVAGIKDKDAVTSQYVSAFNIKASRLESLKIRDIKIKVIGYSDRPLKLGSLRGNNFRIAVKGLKRNLKAENPVAVPNYYGIQRFGGSVRPNTHEVGKLLVKRDFKGAMKKFLAEPYETETVEFSDIRNSIESRWGEWRGIYSSLPKPFAYEKRAIASLIKDNGNYLKAFKSLPRQLLTLFIHSFQAKLFNDILAEHIIHSFDCKKVSYPAGIFAYPKNIRYSSLRIPLVGYDYRKEDDKAAVITSKVLEMEKINPSSFKFEELPMLSSRTLYRDAFIKVNVDISRKGRDSAALSFFLPKGSYATSVVDYLCNVC